MGGALFVCVWMPCVLSVIHFPVCACMHVAVSVAVLPPLPEEERINLLTTLYQDHYKGSSGQSIFAGLNQRQSGSLLPVAATALRLGAYFPLFGYRYVVRQLVRILDDMELNHQAQPRDLDTYRRQHHNLQLAGPPGSGKTTAATAMWPALHYAVRLLDATQPQLSEGMRERVNISITPSRSLVFGFDFAAGKFNAG